MEDVLMRLSALEGDRGRLEEVVRQLKEESKERDGEIIQLAALVIKQDEKIARLDERINKQDENILNLTKVVMDAVIKKPYIDPAVVISEGVACFNGHSIPLEMLMGWREYSGIGMFFRQVCQSVYGDRYKGFSSKNCEDMRKTVDATISLWNLTRKTEEAMVTTEQYPEWSLKVWAAFQRVIHANPKNPRNASSSKKQSDQEMDAEDDDLAEQGENH